LLARPVNIAHQQFCHEDISAGTEGRGLKCPPRDLRMRKRLFFKDVFDGGTLPLIPMLAVRRELLLRLLGEMVWQHPDNNEAGPTWSILNRQLKHRPVKFVVFLTIWSIHHQHLHGLRQWKSQFTSSTEVETC
jgi:hypothetical protein